LDDGNFLEDHLNKKFNKWRERRGLFCSDQNKISKAYAFSNRRDLSASERATFYLHELTGCQGLEFVAFSNVRIKNPVKLSNDVIVVPCFLNENQRDGLSVQDPLLFATFEMERHHRYVYDGWIPIMAWTKEGVREAVRKIDEALSMFCLSSRVFFEWEPKYPLHSESPSIYYFEDQDIKELETLSELLDSLGEKDRIALYRSIAWLSQSLRLNEPAARFLFLILAIESLAKYIESDSSLDSPLAALKTKRITKDERQLRREECIDTILSKNLENSKTDAIKIAYFECVVGIRKQLEIHLKKVFDPDVKPIELLFEKKVEGSSLYDLRNIIAHGTVDALSEAQRDLIAQRIWDAEKIARRYILTIIKKALRFEPTKGGMKAAIFIGVENMITQEENMHQGPIHMAIIYS
jgi:hypothetical protein